MERTEAMWLWSLTAVRARIAVSTVRPRSRPSIARAMFIEPRLQEMSLPISAYERSSLYEVGVLTCRISEHRLDMLIRPLIGLALFTVSSNMMYG
ncbi:hypothetical protein SRABI128_03837 [Microbacterium sp. Bi128]|nr:hypothetical protein SRABI128_03837 [Microbacterium sp. Bi128]